MNEREFDPVNKTEEALEETVETVEETVEEAVEEVVEEAVETAEETAEETVEETAEEAVEVAAEEATEEIAEETSAPAPKKKNSIWIAVAAIVALVAALIVCVFFVVKFVGEKNAAENEAITILAEGHHVNAHGYPSWSIHYHTHEGETGMHYSYLNESGTEVTMTADEVNTQMNNVVATCGDMTMDNRTLQYYYNEELMSFLNTYYNYLGSMLDVNAPLDEQINNNAEGGQDTWQKTILEMALTRFHTVAALAQEAEKNNYTLSQDETEYLNSMKDMDTLAMYYGYPDSLSLIKDMLGPMATVDTYCAFVEETMMASFYNSYLAESIELTDEEISAYYDANAAVYESQNIKKIDENVINVRHILIQPEAAEDGTISEEAWTAAEEEAQRILQEWKDGEATEDTFAELANTYSTDPGSNGTSIGNGGSTGGLYEEVYPNQMVAEFNDWCFDDARQTGDTEIVKTSYGYHIMYFVSQGDFIYWQNVCADALRSEKVLELRDEIMAGYEINVETANIILMDASTATTPSNENETTVTVTEE